MQNYGFILLIVHLVSTTFVGTNIYRSLPRRPAMAQHNITLHFIDLLGGLTLIGAATLLFWYGSVERALLLLVMLILYNLILRTALFGNEVERLKRSHPDLDSQSARRRVTRRSALSYF